MSYTENIENTPELTRTVEHGSIYPYSIENYHYVINCKTTNTISEVWKAEEKGGAE
jgi:hypothetical protein